MLLHHLKWTTHNDILNNCVSKYFLTLIFLYCEHSMQHNIEAKHITFEVKMRGLDSALATY